MLQSIWQGFDLFFKELILTNAIDPNDKKSERYITQLLEPRIRKCWNEDMPFFIQHGSYEYETAASTQAQPPEYDLAVICYGGERLMWPLEAKILKTDGEVAEYIKEIKNNYLTCRYAPFSSSAAMLGYLLSGIPDKAFENIAKKGKWTLNHHSDFPKRDHRTSKHIRKVPKGKTYPSDFECHHLIFKM